jgi:protein with PEP-CTERM/exosortase system signal
MKLTMKRNIVPHKNKAVIAVIIALTGLGLNQAHATRSPLPPATVSQPFISDFDVGNDGIDKFAAPYGQLSISLAGQTATVTFHSNTINGNTYLFGGNNAFALNVNSSSFTAGAFAGTRVGGFTGTLGPGGSQNMNGFGVFNFSIADSDGFKDAFDGLSFTLTNTSGVLWNSANDVLKANASGYDAAGHVFVSQLVNGKYKNLNATGFAAETAPHNNVPDGGATVMLLGGALSVLGVVRRFIS